MASTSGVASNNRLFSRNCVPLTFFIAPCRRKESLRQLIMSNGGEMCADRGDAQYILYNPGDVVSDNKMVSTEYIDDCVKENKTLDIEQYRATAQPHAATQSNAAAQPHAATQSNAAALPSDAVQADVAADGLNLDTDLREISPTSSTNRFHIKKREYTEAEDLSVISAVLGECKHHSINGNRLWEIIAAKQERFIKKILPYIDRYNIARDDIHRLKTLYAAKSERVASQRSTTRFPQIDVTANKRRLLSSSSDEEQCLTSDVTFPRLPMNRKRKAPVIELTSSSESSGLSGTSQRSYIIERSPPQVRCRSPSSNHLSRNMQARKTINSESTDADLELLGTPQKSSAKLPSVVVRSQARPTAKITSPLRVSCDGGTINVSKTASGSRVPTEIESRLIMSNSRSVKPSIAAAQQVPHSQASAGCSKDSNGDQTPECLENSDDSPPCSQPFTVSLSVDVDKSNTPAQHHELPAPTNPTLLHGYGNSISAEKLIDKNSLRTISGESSALADALTDLSPLLSAEASMLNNSEKDSGLDQSHGGLCQSEASAQRPPVSQDKQNTSLTDDESKELFPQLLLSDSLQADTALCPSMSLTDQSEGPSVSPSLVFKDKEGPLETQLSWSSWDPESLKDKRISLESATSDQISSSAQCVSSVNAPEANCEMLHRSTNHTRSRGTGSSSTLAHDSAAPVRTDISSAPHPQKLITCLDNFVDVNGKPSPAEQSDVARDSQNTVKQKGCKKLSVSENNQPEECGHSLSAFGSCQFCQVSTQNKNDSSSHLVTEEGGALPTTGSDVTSALDKQSCTKLSQTNKLKSHAMYKKLKTSYQIEDSVLFGFVCQLSADWQLLEQHFKSGGKVGTLWTRRDDGLLTNPSFRKKNIRELRKKFTDRELQNRRTFLLERVAITPKQRNTLLGMRR